MMYISAANTDTVKVIGNGLSGGRLKEAPSSGLTRQQSNYFDLREAHQLHSWLRATCAAFGRTVIGPGMVLAEAPAYVGKADIKEKEFLNSFYTGIAGRDFTNISDWYPFSSKLYRTAGQFRLFGQSTWELRRNGWGEVVSYDVIPGFVWPNCNQDGTFKDPPFKQYISSEQMKPLELNPDDIVMFMNPDFGARMFATDFESLSEYVLPTDIYLITAMKSLLENNRTPFGVHSLDEHATQDEVTNFSNKLDALYRGAKQYGKSAVVVRGETDFKTFVPPLKDLPFQEGHNQMKDEIEGVSGVSGGKLGRTDEVNRSNLREIRRDYWETTHQPVTEMLADQMYLLIHQRIFGIDAWRPLFGAPDSLTQVEKATVGMRGRQWGALNTNELREFVFDRQRIDEEWADNDYLWPKNMVIAGSETLDGEEPSSEPNTDSDPPIRGDTNNTEEAREQAISEMRAYARYTLKRLGTTDNREFNFKHVPEGVVSLVSAALEGVTSRDNAKQIFDAVLGGMTDG